MEEIKQRISLVRGFITQQTTFGQERYDYEFVSLHLRKVLELIAFSSLVANKEKYSQAHEKYLHEWRTNQILKNLENLNPNFYPKPSGQPEKDNHGVIHFPNCTKAYLSQNDFIKLLNLCNDVLHVWNPYSPREKTINFELPVLEWIQKIQWLLDIHYIQLADSEEVWLVMMSDGDGKVHAYLATSNYSNLEDPTNNPCHAAKKA